MGLPLPTDAELDILAALLHNLRPHSIVVIETDAGWESLVRHGRIFRQYSGLFGVSISSRIETQADSPRHRQIENCVAFLSRFYGEDPTRWEGDAQSKLKTLPVAASAEQWAIALSEFPGPLAAKSASAHD